jgi:hypothetical protein
VAATRARAVVGRHCADRTREESVDPIGTAGSYRGFLLVEWPKPWPRDVGEIPELANVCEAAAELRIRVQAVDGLLDSAEDRRHIVLYRGTSGRPHWFRGFQGVERTTSQHQLAREALGLLHSGDGTATAGSDVLICGHGQRDVCCGSRGSRLAVELIRNGVNGARVWRTSHTGGHRFAPTAVVLPDATSWGYLDASSLRRIIDRDGDAADLTPLYRGCAALPTPAAQALERVAFAETGWQWLDADRRATEDTSDGRVRLEAIMSAGSVRHWEGRAYQRREILVPACVGDSSASGKTQPELGVLDVTRGERPLATAEG